MSSNDSKAKKFWNWINKIHLYRTKAEAVFKAIIITISWVGGVHFSNLTDMEAIGTSFYLFSLSLIMEYIVGLLTAKRAISRIFPFVICFSSVLAFIWSTAILLGNPFVNINNEHLQQAINVSLYVIWFDTIIMVLINPTKNENIENNLNNI